MSTVTSAIKLIGLSPIARLFGYRPSAVQKWRDDGRLPQSDLAGLTFYAAAIAALSSKTETPVTADELLADTRAAWQAKPSIKSGRRGKGLKRRRRVG